MLSVHRGLKSLHLERPRWSVSLSVSALYSIPELMIHDPRERESSEVSRHCLCDDTELRMSIAKRTINTIA